MNIKKLIQKIALSPAEEVIFRMQAASIRWQNWKKNPPILIYQMGKVGSSSVYHSLKQAGLDNPLYQIHYLNPKTIQKVIRNYFEPSGTSLPKHILLSQALRRKIDTTQDIQLKVITLVRDPIGRTISDIFENPHAYDLNIIDPNGDFDMGVVNEKILNLFSQYNPEADQVCTWFDREMKPTFGIDIYDYPFDHKEGYFYLKKDNFELLVIRLENLSSAFTSAIDRLLITDNPIPLLNTNVGATKMYAHDYKRIKEGIMLPRDITDIVYASKYAQHFYDEEMRKLLINKWTK